MRAKQDLDAAEIEDDADDEDDEEFFPVLFFLSDAALDETVGDVDDEEEPLLPLTSLSKR
jgi:hypothetical protein